MTFDVLRECCTTLFSDHFQHFSVCIHSSSCLFLSKKLQLFASVQSSDDSRCHGFAEFEQHRRLAIPHEILEGAVRLVLKHTPGSGVFPSPVPGVTLYRITSQTFIERSAGELLSTYIIQGRKSTAIGGKVLEYGPGESLVSVIASPSEFHRKSARKPAALAAGGIAARKC